MAKSTPYKKFSKLLAHTTVVLEAARRYAFRNLTQYKSITLNRPMTLEEACRCLLRCQGVPHPDHFDQRVTEHAVMAPIKIYCAALHSAYEFFGSLRNDAMFKNIKFIDDSLKDDPFWEGISLFRDYYVHPEAGHQHSAGKVIEDIFGTEKLVQCQKWILENLKVMRGCLHSKTMELVGDMRVTCRNYEIIAGVNAIVCTRMRGFNDVVSLCRNEKIFEKLMPKRPSGLVEGRLRLPPPEEAKKYAVAIPSSREFDLTHSNIMPRITEKAWVYAPSMPKYAEIENHWQHMMDAFVWLHEVGVAYMEIMKINNFGMEDAMQPTLDEKAVPYFGFFCDSMFQNWSAAVTAISVALLWPHIELYQAITLTSPALRNSDLDSLLDGQLCEICKLRNSVWHVANPGNCAILPDYYHGRVHFSPYLLDLFTVSEVNPSETTLRLHVLYSALREFYELVNERKLPIKEYMAEYRRSRAGCNRQGTSGKKF